MEIVLILLLSRVLLGSAGFILSALQINPKLSKEDFIRLDSALKLASLVSTGGHAKIVIQSGEVKVNGEICEMRGKKMRPGDVAEVYGKSYMIASAEPFEE